MKIDFENFPVCQGIGKEAISMDVRRVFAEEIYNNGQGLAFHALALKIYNAKGDEDYSDEEYRLMVTFSEQCMSPAFIDSLRAIGETAAPKEG